MGAGLIAHSALTPSVMDGKSHLFHNLMLLLRAICQYAQFAKCSAPFWNHARTVCQFLTQTWP